MEFYNKVSSVYERFIENFEIKTNEYGKDDINKDYAELITCMIEFRDKYLLDETRNYFCKDLANNSSTTAIRMRISSILERMMYGRIGSFSIIASVSAENPFGYYLREREVSTSFGLNMVVDIDVTAITKDEDLEVIIRSIIVQLLLNELNRATVSSLLSGYSGENEKFFVPKDEWNGVLSGIADWVHHESLALINSPFTVMNTDLEDASIIKRDYNNIVGDLTRFNKLINRSMLSATITLADICRSNLRDYKLSCPELFIKYCNVRQSNKFRLINLLGYTDVLSKLFYERKDYKILAYFEELKLKSNFSSSLQAEALDAIITKFKNSSEYINESLSGDFKSNIKALKKNNGKLFKRSKAKPNTIEQAIKTYSGRLYEYGVRAKNILDESEALVLTREINSIIYLLEDYRDNYNLPDNVYKKIASLCEEYYELRRLIVKQNTSKYSYIGILAPKGLDKDPYEN